MNTRNHQNAHSNEWTLERTFKAVQRKRGVKVVQLRGVQKLHIYVLNGGDQRHPSDVGNGTRAQLDFLQKQGFAHIRYVSEFPAFKHTKKSGYKKHAVSRR